MSGPCTRPECGGEVHTDGWGTPIRCPRAMNVACAVLHTDAEGNLVPCPGYPHGDPADGSEPSTAVELGDALRAARSHLNYWQQRVDQLDRQVGRFTDQEQP